MTLGVPDAGLRPSQAFLSDLVAVCASWFRLLAGYSHPGPREGQHRTSLSIRQRALPEPAITVTWYLLRASGSIRWHARPFLGRNGAPNHTQFVQRILIRTPFCQPGQSVAPQINQTDWLENQVLLAGTTLASTDPSTGLAVDMDTFYTKSLMTPSNKLMSSEAISALTSWMSSEGWNTTTVGVQLQLIFCIFIDGTVFTA